MGCDLGCRLHPSVKRRQATVLLQRIARRYHPPELVEAEAPEGKEARLAMTGVRRIKSAAKKADRQAFAVRRQAAVDAVALTGRPCSPLFGMVFQGRVADPWTRYLNSSAARRRPVTRMHPAVWQCRLASMPNSPLGELGRGVVAHAGGIHFVRTRSANCGAGEISSV